MNKNYVSCGCGDLYAPDSFGAGFIAATGQCPNCKAAQPSAEPVGFVSQDFLDGKWSLDHIAKTDTGQISRVIPVFTRAQPSAEPAGYFHNITAGGDLIQRWEQSEWAEDGAVPLYAHPATAELEALRRDAEIGKLVRLKMTSGNSVPVERCIITAAEIAAIAQQEPSHDNQ